LHIKLHMLAVEQPQVEKRYRLTRILGKGACGVVYEARALAPAFRSHGYKKVALKLLAEDQIGDAGAIARFTHEAFLLSKLDHPNLVRVLDFGFASPGRPYYAMELLEGATLDVVLADEALPKKLALQLLADAARALAELHKHGIVHRDVKPSNLFVVLGGKRPRLRLLDLGVAGVFDATLAKRLGSVDVGAKGTYGTPAYLAPEQALGHATSAATDVYALACVAYRLFCGTDALRASTMTKTVHLHLFEQPKPPSAHDASLAPLDAVFARALEKNPERRTASARQFVAELRAALSC
jgi:serine/threonine-protein kinase